MRNYLLRTVPAMYLLFTILTTNFAHAKKIEGFKFPDEIILENKKLVLNGLAIRKATIFRIKILVAGLYLEKTSDDPSIILNSETTKHIQIRFLKSVSSKTISKMWAKSLLQKCKQECAELEKQVTQLGAMLVDINSGDSLMFTFINEQVKIVQNNNRRGLIEGKNFLIALLSLWIGKNPLDEDLKKGLLGVAVK